MGVTLWRKESCSVKRSPFCLYKNFFFSLFSCPLSLQCLYGCYVHSSIIPTFHRRCYWLLQVSAPILLLYSSPHFSSYTQTLTAYQQELKWAAWYQFSFKRGIFPLTASRQTSTYSPPHPPSLFSFLSRTSISLICPSHSLSLMALPIHAVRHGDGISGC